MGYSGLPCNTKDGSTFAWLPEAEFARVSALDKGLVEQLVPDILRRVFDPGGKALVFDPGGVSTGLDGLCTCCHSNGGCN